MAGITREEYEKIAQEVRQAWDRAGNKEAGLKVIGEFGRKYGYKNVIAALEGRLPRQFTREKSVDAWVEEQRGEEAEVS